MGRQHRYYGKGGRLVIFDEDELKRVRSSREVRLEIRNRERRERRYLASLKWRCRYLDNIRFCEVRLLGYCGKDGLRCKQVCDDGSVRVLGRPDVSPFDAF
jgi:hypothetical protein